MKHALIVAFFGRLRDRFCEYGSPLSITEKLRRAAAVPGVQGAEIIFPDECAEPALVMDALGETGLAPAAINVNLKGRPEFQRGALCAPDAAVRKQAIDLMLAAKEFAVSTGAERVTCAPLADGVDYPLHHEYAAAWKRTVGVLRTALDEGPNVPIHLEHKPSDPRVRGLLATSDLVLRLIEDLERANAGITFNAGHASVDGVSPAACLAQVFESGAPLYIHFCDAGGGWDWDLLSGSHHFWQFCEFLTVLSDHGYAGWLTADTFPVRQDADQLFALNIERANFILERIAAQKRPPEDSEPVIAWKAVEQCWFPGN
jgi:sugar phosphate isomerase/epimerase